MPSFCSRRPAAAGSSLTYIKACPHIAMIMPANATAVSYVRSAEHTHMHARTHAPFFRTRATRVCRGCSGGSKVLYLGAEKRRKEAKATKRKRR
eukprot:4573493-Alexandrium_andersonii.AAC.1